MSLKTIPFFGKSDTSRTAARSFSTIPDAIGANAIGLQRDVNSAFLSHSSFPFVSNRDTSSAQRIREVLMQDCQLGTAI
jgi:hypothetical protein